MTELATWRPGVITTAPEPTIVNYQDAAIQRLSEWAQSADAAHRIAQTLVQTSFCPQQFRGKPGEATAAILAGLEVGLQPMAALRSFDIIQNQAAPRAITLRAIVQSYGHEMVLVESTSTRCKMKGRRRGTDEWQTVTWTIERARDLQLTGKDNWKKQPAAMLVARATSELARLIASDAILGIGYSVEEIADGGPEQQAAVDTGTPAEPAPVRVMSRRTRPTVSEAEGAPEVAAPVSEPATSASESPLLNTSSKLAKAMFAALGETGIIEKDERLTYVSAVVGREVTSSKEMTDDDARKVLDSLNDGDDYSPASSTERLTEDAVVDVELPDPTAGDDPWSAS